MQQRGAHGAKMAEYFGARRAPIHTRSLQLDSRIAITHMRCDGPGTGLTEPIPRERALVVAFQFQPLALHELWIGGKPQAVAPYARGAVSTVDLDSEPVAYLGSAFDTLQFYLPQSALNDMADAQGSVALRELHIPHGVADPILEQISLMARHLNAHPEQACAVLLDTLALMLHAHLAHNYAGLTQPAPMRPGGLAPWQERRVKELIEEQLGAGLGLAEMAAVCGLSPSHFARAFKHSTGEPPHRWLRRRRVARVQHLLLTSALMLSDIALACGYADQSHLSKEFNRATGLSPGAWRRAHASRQRAIDAAG